MKNPALEQIRSARGGKRAGSGRKPEGKIQVSYKLAPDVVEFLRSNEKPASQLIENAVREHYGITEKSQSDVFPSDPVKCAALGNF